MSTKLPEAVQRQLEEAERIDGELAQPAEPPASPPPSDPPPTPPADTPPAPVVTEETWQSRYLSLQGKYNTEVVPLRDRVAELTEEVRQLKEARPSTPPPEPAAPAPAEKLVTPQDVDTFGADMVDLMRRIAREEDAGEQARLRQELNELKAKLPTLEKNVDTVTSVTVETRRQTYLADLAKLVPDWEPINVDDAFKAWLDQPDPLSGNRRQDLLNTAFSAFDHARTAVIFNAFKQDTGRAAPPPVVSPPAPAAEGLEAQVSPPSGRAPADPTPAGDMRIWTAQEVQDVYTAKTRGDFRGRDAEFARLDAEIDQAFIDGRVRG